VSNFWGAYQGDGGKAIHPWLRGMFRNAKQTKARPRITDFFVLLKEIV
jgi:hypothetical protein